MYRVTADVVKLAVAICGFLVKGGNDFVLCYLN